MKTQVSKKCFEVVGSHTGTLKIRSNGVVEASAATFQQPSRVEKYDLAYDAVGHTFCTLIASTRGPIHLEAQRLLYFIAQATTRLGLV